MANNYVIELENVYKHFGGIVALKNTSVAVERGTIHAFVGENGAGKSTMMKILSGVYTMDSGIIRINGKEVKITSRAYSEELGIAFIPQELAFVPNFTVAENIFLGQEQLKKGFPIFIDKSRMYREAKEFLDKVNIKLDPKALAKDLSVSEKQMMVIAKNFSHNSDIIIMDEPTARLDHQDTNLLLDYLKYLKSIGKTIIFITHRLDEVFRCCDKVTVLRDGQIVGNKRIQDITKDELIRLMVNRDIKGEKLERVDKEIGKVVFSVKNFSKKGIFSDINFDVREGEILGLYGLVGAGRTEIVRAIIGIDKKDSGDVYLDGGKIKLNSAKSALKHGIVLVPKERREQGLILSMSIKDNVTLSTLKDYTKNIFINFSKERKAATDILTRIRTKMSGIDQIVGDLSGGNQQKVVLGKHMIRENKLYFFDEPTRGIDVGAKKEIYILIQQLAIEKKAIVVVSSELPEIACLCDRVLAIKDGRIAGEMIVDDSLDFEEVLKQAIEG